MTTRRKGHADSSWPWQKWRDLMRHVQLAYGDPKNPRMDFVSVEFREAPYRDIVRDLSLEASITDDTDINCDVCFSYIIESDGILLLRLSMVGPYAMFERIEESGDRFLIVTKEDCSSDIEHAVHRALVRHDFTLLSAAQLRTPIELILPFVENTTVYHGLFTREGELPPVD